MLLYVVCAYTILVCALFWLASHVEAWRGWDGTLRGLFSPTLRVQGGAPMHEIPSGGVGGKDGTGVLRWDRDARTLSGPTLLQPLVVPTRVQRGKYSRNDARVRRVFQMEPAAYAEATQSSLTLAPWAVEVHAALERRLGASIPHGVFVRGVAES